MSDVVANVYFRYPGSIRSLMSADDRFLSAIGIVNARIVNIGGICSVRAGELFRKVREHLATRKVVELTDDSGKKVSLSSDKISLKIVVSSGKNKQKARLSSFDLLSNESDVRVEAVSKLVQSCGPASPDLSGYIGTARRRELSDAEVHELFQEARGGVAGVQRRAELAFARGEASIADLVPSHAEYYELLCGPDPKFYEATPYLTGPLGRHRRSLLARDRARGLSICMLGAISESLSPGDWVSDLGKDALWEMLTSIDYGCEPYSLLAALDICLRRDRDIRFRKRAGEIVALLAQDSLPDDSGNDAYELLACFVNLTLDQLNRMDFAIAKPPYWKRLCAWTHGGMLVRAARNRNVDPIRMNAWISEQLSEVATMRRLLDLGVEPMFSSMLFSKEAIRGEVLGRVLLLHARHVEKGRTFPNAKVLKAWIDKNAKADFPLMPFSPGPLEGSNRAIDVTPIANGSLSTASILKRLRENPFGPVWSVIAQLSQCHAVDSEIVELAIEELGTREISTEQVLQEIALTEMALVAVACREERIMEVVGKVALTLTPRIASTDDVLVVVYALLVASCCIEKSSERAKWLESRFENFALSLPTSSDLIETSNSLLMAVDHLRPNMLALTSRARAMLSAA